MNPEIAMKLYKYKHHEPDPENKHKRRQSEFRGFARQVCSKPRKKKR